MKSAVLLVFFMIGIAISAEAQDCSAITSQGIFDVSSKSKETDLVTNFISFLERNEFKTESEAKSKSFGLNIIIPVIDVPVKLGVSSKSDKSGSWSKSAVDYLKTNSQAREKFSGNFRTANPHIVNAWKECVTQKKGLVVGQLTRLNLRSLSIWKYGQHRLLLNCLLPSNPLFTQNS